MAEVTKTEAPSVVINDIRIQAVNRSKKNIENWRNGLRAAEAIGNPNRTTLYDIYSDILLDPHLQGVLRKWRDGVLNKRIEYVDKDEKQVKDWDSIISSRTFRNILTQIIDKDLWGISGMEFIPGIELNFKPIPRKHIKPTTGQITFEQNATTGGISYKDYPNIWVVQNSEDDFGMLLNVVPYAIYKKDALGDWSNYIEVFGQPVRIIKYDAYDEQNLNQLRSVLDESGSALAILIPKQADFEMKDGKASNGDGQLQERFVDYLDSQMSIAILGNTETTTNGKTGSQAKSKTHQEQQEEITRSLMAIVTSHLNDPHFIAILQSYGLPVTEGGRFRFTTEIDVVKLKDRIAIDKELSQLIPMDDDYYYTTYGVPKPANYDQIKKAQQETPPQNEPPKGKKDKPGKQDPAKQQQLTAAKLSRWKNLRNALSYFFD